MESRSFPWDFCFFFEKNRGKTGLTGGRNAPIISVMQLTNP